MDGCGCFSLLYELRLDFSIEASAAALCGSLRERQAVRRTRPAPLARRCRGGARVFRKRWWSCAARWQGARHGAGLSSSRVTVASGRRLNSEIVFGESGNLHQRTKQPNFQRLVSVNRDHDSFPPTRHGEDVMTAVHPGQLPPVPLYKTRKLPPGDLLHTATSIT